METERSNEEATESPSVSETQLSTADQPDPKLKSILQEADKPDTSLISEMAKALKPSKSEKRSDKDS